MIRPSSFSLVPRFAIAAATVPLMFAVGCSMGTMSTNATFSPGAVVKGQTFGGHQPIVGATVKLYAAGATGYGSAATLYATTTSANDGQGSFSFTKSATNTGPTTPTQNVYGCPISGDPQMYLIASGGNTQGAGTDTNSAAVFAVAIGKCSTITAATFVNMNEVTSAATMAALQQYFNPSTESFGYAATAQSAAGFATGVATISNLANVATGLANTSTTVSQTPANATSPITVTITPELNKINTIADVAAACVQSATGAATDGQNNPTNCGTIFTNAVPPSPAVTSQPSGTFPTATDVLQATYYMLSNPVDGSSANLTNLYNLVNGGSPFQPTLAAAPTDWTVGVTYSAPISTTACTAPVNYIQYVYQLSVDGSGNVWMANGNGTASGISSMSPTGTPLSCSDIAYTTVRGGAVIDTAGNVWTTSNGTSNLYKYNPTSNTTTTVTVPTGSSAGRSYGIAADGSGNVFISDPTNLKAYEVPSSATSATIPTLLGTVTGSSPYTVAVDTKGTVIVGQSGSGGSTITAFPKVTTTGAAYNTPQSLAQTGYYAGVYGIAFDASGAFWVGNSAGTSASASTPPGNTTSATPLTYTVDGSNNITLTAGTPTKQTGIFAGGLSTARLVAIDGAGNVWTPNNTASSSTMYSVTEISNAGAAISPTSVTAGTPPATTSTSNGGFQKAATVLAGPRGIAIDPTGNVWVSNTAGTNNNFITEIVGAAVPVVTPLSVATQNSQLGAKP